MALFTVLLGVGVSLINRQYFFHDAAIATGDQAANTLEVLQSKRFQNYLGNYSRWGFYHPGPAFFYYLAAAETVFWQWLHVTPAPFNAQVLSVLWLTSACFAVGLSIAARWVRSVFFIPLALLLCALHFTAVHLQVSMLDPWTAYVELMPYFCLLIAAASVAAGQGEDLSWLVVAGCFLIHLHVASPIFVLPLFLVAYAGLLWAGQRGPTRTGDEAAPARWPWQRYWWGHVVAVAVTALFVLPMVVDLCRGKESNFAKIWNHLRTHRGQKHTYIDAFQYILNFGVYKPLVPGNPALVEGAKVKSVWHFVISHPEMMLFWLAALLTPMLALGLRYGLKPLGGGDRENPVEALDRPRWRFLGCLLAVFALSFGLALFWAHIQDGAMLYYNAWYIFAWYGVLTVIAAVALSDALDRVAARFWRPAPLAGTVVIILLVATELFFGWPHLPINNYAAVDNYAATHPMVETVERALNNALPDSPRTKFIVIPDELALGSAPGIAVMLTRIGCPFRVAPPWKVMFGHKNALPEGWASEAGVVATQPSAMEPWWIIHPKADPGQAFENPLIDGFALKVGYTKIDPNTGGAILLTGPDRNSDAFVMTGFLWAGPAADRTWTVEKIARLEFAAQPVAPNQAVEVTFDFLPPFVNATTHTSQRLEASYNGAPLGSLTLRANTPPDTVRFRMPAAVWNAQSLGVLLLRFPDAISPAEMDGNPKGDARRLGFAAKKIVFQAVAADPAPPAAP